MKTTHLAVLATLILSSQAFAQTLPDEINHPQYLRLYQNLEQVLQQKTAEYNKLSEAKAVLEKSIAQMEKDQVELPARNAELKRMIESRQAEVVRLNSEIEALERILGGIIEDLRRLDAMIAQLQNDLNEEGRRSSAIEARRQQVASELAALNSRLNREINEENQSVQVLNRLIGELNGTVERQELVVRERALLIRDVDRFKVEVVASKNLITKNNSTLGTKRPQLTDAEAKLTSTKSELATEQAKLSQIDATLNPKKTQLAALKAELARLSPDVARLQSENKSLEQKISGNNTKITSLNVSAQVTRRDALEAEISGVKGQIRSNNDAQVALQEKLKPTMGQINDLTTQLREASRTRNAPEVERLKKEIDSLKATIEPDQKEILRLSKETEKLAISIAARQGEINKLNETISKNEAQIATLEKEIEVSRVKIAENEKKISEIAAANGTLSKQIADLETEVKALEAQRAPTATKVASLSTQEKQLSSSVTTLTAEIQKLQADNARLTTQVAEMEKAIVEFPQNLRRLDAHIKSLHDKAFELRGQVDREQRLLARIRQDRMTAQTARDQSQAVYDQVAMDLADSQRLVGAIRNKLNEEVRNRDALARYNQDSIRKLDTLNASKARATKEIADASEEIKVNEQDIGTIAQELPLQRTELNALNPKVASALTARNAAQASAKNANTEYQNRLALYQNYLSEAQQMGSDKASIGTTDGTKAGAVDAKTVATKLASESASAEAKWEAIRRGYVRGEVAGFENGFDVGMSSSADAMKGEEEGRVAGARRAKDHANQVVKPAKYLEELERRLREDETSSAPVLAKMVRQELSMIKAMASELQETIPDLTAAEISAAARIVSSLDAMITQSEIEIDEVLNLRKSLAVAANTYSAPAPGANAQTVNCAAVYKSVKDFVEACKGSYVIRYQNLYNSAHAETYKREYSSAFNTQIDRIFDAELNRLYPVSYKEGFNVAKEVGVASGKAEIYQQSFNRSENATYSAKLPSEVSRVETEAVKLVQEHLNQNAALTLKGEAKLSTASAYGIAPGAEAELKMLIKNIGDKASQNNSLVKFTEVSSNLSLERNEAPLASVAAKSHADLSVIKVKVNDDALPGKKVVVAGEIVHAGNHYRSNRVESFRIETVVAVNPSIDSSVDYDTTPTVATIFVTRKHGINIKVKPKYAGVEAGYEATLEEVGTNFVDVIYSPEKTEVLGRGVEKNLNFTYRLSKAARGKAVKLKITIKNDGAVVAEHLLEIKPQ